MVFATILLGDFRLPPCDCRKAGNQQKVQIALSIRESNKP